MLQHGEHYSFPVHAFNKAYTHIMLKHLQHSRTAVCQGRAIAIGGHGGKDGNLSTALRYMRSWVSMVGQTVLAEFPSWSILQCFCVLNPKTASLNSDDLDRLQRFAQLFKISFAQLRQDISFALPHVVDMARSSKLSTYEMWKSVLTRHQRSKPLPALRQFLLRYGSYSGCTTSGVEHVHNAHEWLFTTRRNGAYTFGATTCTPTTRTVIDAMAGGGIACNRTCTPCCVPWSGRAQR